MAAAGGGGALTAAVVDAMANLAIPGQSAWPDSVQLYQPNKDTILLNDAACCRSAEAYLRFCKLPYELRCRKNAEFMSPTGNVPFLKIGSDLVAEFHAIAAHIQAKGLSVSTDLEPSERAEVKAYVSLIEDSLVPAELHMLWCQKECVRRTQCQYGSPYPAPLNLILSYIKQWAVCRNLKAIGWHHKTSHEVMEEVKRVCEALSVKLGKNRYFIGDKPTELDALVFGHLHSLLTRYLPDPALLTIIKTHKNLEEFVTRILQEYF